MKENESNKSASEKFEDELDDFFKSRALLRSASVADQAKNSSAKERDDELTSLTMSGCCMTGCPDCPWNYKPPLV